MKLRIGLASTVLAAIAVFATTAILAQNPEDTPEPPCTLGCAFEPAVEQVMVFSGRGAWLGVRLEDVTRERIAELKLKEEFGAVVAEVVENSPAAKAGLQKNDVILDYQGVRVESAATLGRLVRETPEGRLVRLLVSRDGRQQTLTATIERREPLRGSIRVPEIRLPELNIEIFGSRPPLGVSVDQLTPQLADYFGVKQGKGLLVREVNAGSPAEKGGLKAGDVIVRVEGETVEDVNDLRRALGKKKGGESVTLTIIRNRAETSLPVQLEETPRTPRPPAAISGRDEAEIQGEVREAMREVQREMRDLQLKLREEQRQEQRELIRMKKEWVHQLVI